MQATNHITSILFIGSLLCTSLAHAETPTLAWETDAGFKQPESAVYDADRDVLYVSNINGQGTDKDGNGYISKVALDGTVTEAEWVTGLDGPKGLAIAGDKLYVSDITALVEIDINQGAVLNRYEAEGAVFMNDVAADEAGNIYVSDIATNTLHRLSGGTFEAWVVDEELENPNGLLVEGENLIVGAWGKMKEDFSTEVPGHLKTVALSDGSINDLGDGQSIGNLDGVESDGQGNYYATDWMAGTLMYVTASGEAEVLLELGQGSADLEVVASEGLVVIPMMKDGKLVAYKLVP